MKSKHNGTKINPRPRDRECGLFLDWNTKWYGDKSDFNRLQEQNTKNAKEVFRKFAIVNGFADEIVIDNDTYSELSEITGCFQDENGDWVVYDTDERGKPFNVEKHTSQVRAFIKIAKKFGVEEEYMSIIAHEDKFPDRVVTFDGPSSDCTPEYRSRRGVNISDKKKWLLKYRGSTKHSERVNHELPEGFIPGKVTVEGMSAVSESIREKMFHEEHKQ